MGGGTELASGGLDVALGGRVLSWEWGDGSGLGRAMPIKH